MRYLKKEEKEILKKMLKDLNYAKIFLRKINTVKVIDMDDGDMGSIKFIYNSSSNHKKRCFKGCVLKAEFYDTDNVLVEVSLNIDNDNNIYELDFWKVDFSPLNEYPSSQNLILLPN